MERINSVVCVMERINSDVCVMKRINNDAGVTERIINDVYALERINNDVEPAPSFRFDHLSKKRMLYTFVLLTYAYCTYIFHKTRSFSLYINC